MTDALLTKIDHHCGEMDFGTVLSLCKDYDLPHFGKFLTTLLSNYRTGLDSNGGLTQYKHYFDTIVFQIDNPHNNSHDNIYVRLLCNWTNDLNHLWSKMIPVNSHVQLTDDDKEADYWVIINKPPDNAYYIPKKTIVFQMEPIKSTWMSENFDPSIFFKIFDHANDYNNIEWHLSVDHHYLSTTPITKSPELKGRVSAVLSNKYWDPLHILRLDFMTLADKEIPFDVFGTNLGYKSYMGKLPYHEKDKALFPYQYHFNAENHAIPNYFTEKIIDGILCECLCFYMGAPNIGDYIDHRAFIVLNLEDVEGSIRTIKEAIANNEWSLRLPYIKAAKHKILSEMNFFTRIENEFKNELEL